MELFNLIANHYKVERIPINLTWLCTYKTCKLLLETPSLPLNNAVDPRSSDPCCARVQTNTLMDTDKNLNKILLK